MNAFNKLIAITLLFGTAHASGMVTANELNNAIFMHDERNYTSADITSFAYRCKQCNNISAPGHDLLHGAVLIGKHSLIPPLIDAGVNVNSQEATTLETPLHIAVTNIWLDRVSTTDAITILRQKGANTEITNKAGKRPIDLITTANSSPEMLERVRKALYDPIDPAPPTQATPTLPPPVTYSSPASAPQTSTPSTDVTINDLFTAINIYTVDDDAALERFTDLCKRCTNITGTRGLHNKSLLHYAVMFNRNALIPVLIAAGISVDARDSLGRTPLYVATDNFVTNRDDNALEIIKLLRNHNANPFISSTNDEETPVTLSENEDLSSDRKQQLIDALNLPIVPLSTTPQTPPVTTQSSAPANQQAAFRAVRGIKEAILNYGDVVSADMTIDEFKTLCKKTDLNLRDEFGQTLLQIAIMNHKDDLILPLIEAGADFRACNSVGNQLLHIAAFYNNATAVKILTDKGVSTRVTNNAGQRPDELTNSDEIKALLTPPHYQNNSESLFTPVLRIAASKWFWAAIVGSYLGYKLYQRFNKKSTDEEEQDISAPEHRLQKLRKIRQ